MDEINKIAKGEGWELAYVIDNGKTRPHIEILGVGGVTNMLARRFVMEKAKSYSSLHVNAMQLCINSRVPQPATRKKK